MNINIRKKKLNQNRMTTHCQVNFEIIQNQKSLYFDTVPNYKKGVPLEFPYFRERCN